MNKILMAQVMGIMLALFHIVTHSWLFDRIEDKEMNDQLIAGMGLGLNIIFFLLVIYQIAKAKGLLKKLRKPKLGGVPPVVAGFGM